MKNIFTQGKLKDLSLRNKIIIMTFGVAFIPAILLAVIIMSYYGHAIEQRSGKHIEENIHFMSQQIEQIFSDGVLCTNYLTLTANTIASDSNMRQVDRDSAIQSALNRTILIFDGIDSILYLDEQDRMYFTNVAYGDRQEEIRQSVYMEDLKDITNGKTLLFDQKDDCMMLEPSKPVVTMGKKVVNIVSGETLGYLFINIDIDALEASMQHQISYYLLLDNERNCVAGLENETLLNGLQGKAVDENTLLQTPIRYEGKKYLVVSNHLEEAGWQLIGITNLNEYNINASEMIKMLLAAGFVSVLLLMLLSFNLSNNITKPLIKLKNGAEEISRGNLKIRFHYKSGDEIGRLGDIFNYMAGKIEELIHTAEEAGKKKREYELALIQQQVKPHFLYNTLDIIIILIDMNKAREAKRVTKKLADYYKNSLSSSEEIIPMEKELQIVEDYLELQLMRYIDKFTYEIKTEGSVNDFMIPKMTLQPLVENALYHGLKCKEGSGTIEIEVIHQEDNIYLKVKDDGIGMTEEARRTMIQLKEKAQKHFGLYSVNHRLKLYYGDSYHMEIKSVYGEGTEIVICLPIAGRAETEL